jgi:hypothetical protein
VDAFITVRWIFSCIVMHVGHTQSRVNMIERIVVFRVHMVAALQNRLIETCKLSSRRVTTMWSKTWARVVQGSFYWAHQSGAVVSRSGSWTERRLHSGTQTGATLPHGGGGVGQTSLGWGWGLRRNNVD